MIIYDIIKWLNIFIVLNPFLAMGLSIMIGVMLDRLYLSLNLNKTLIRVLTYLGLFIFSLITYSLIFALWWKS